MRKRDSTRSGRICKRDDSTWDRRKFRLSATHNDSVPCYNARMKRLRNWWQEKRTKQVELPAQIAAEGIEIDIARKRIKNFYLRVERPLGRVRVSAPHNASDDEVRSVIFKRLDWIKRQRARIAATPAPVRLRFASGETHFVLGEPVRLEVVERAGRGGSVTCSEGMLKLTVRKRSRFDERERVVREWYRSELKRMIPLLVRQWEPILGVRVADWNVKQMRTRWGTCNIRARRIWLSLELAKYPPACLEYVVVHELVHLLERGHNAKFYGFMDKYLPDWRVRKKELNRRRASGGGG
jgi:predicted metal-dependent hydrolase